MVQGGDLIDAVHPERGVCEYGTAVGDGNGPCCRVEGCDNAASFFMPVVRYLQRDAVAAGSDPRRDRDYIVDLLYARGHFGLGRMLRARM